MQCRAEIVDLTRKEAHMAEERDEIRKIIEDELAGSKLVVRRVGRPLSGDELKSASGGGPIEQPAPGDQCCNGSS
jgi:hypothetical protein